MNQTISLKRLDRILSEMKEVSRRDFIVLTPEGKRIWGTADAADLGVAVSDFSSSPDETRIDGEWMFFKMEMPGGTRYVMLCSLGGDENEASLVGRMALGRVRDFFLSPDEPYDRIGGLRRIISGEVSGDRVGETVHRLGLAAGRYLLFVIQYKNDEEGILAETLENFFVTAPAEMVVEMDGSRIALLKEASEVPGEDYRDFANVIVDNLQTEVMTKVRVGYGDPIENFSDLNRAYQNACTALKIGTVFYGEESVFYYRKLGIGRLIYKLPADLCEMFLTEILGENRKMDLDDETMTTIRKLFDNNLNISETARQLYIHRNTLVYRLERIEKKLGLDIRTFEDAMLFKIAMMVRVHLNEL